MAKERVAAKKPKQNAAKRAKRKNNPKLIAAARELRDRWLEHVQDGKAALWSEGKYNLTRADVISTAAGDQLAAPSSTRLLSAA